jgi:hypothetical protein
LLWIGEDVLGADLFTYIPIHAETWQKLDAGFAERWPKTVSFQ